MRLGRLIRAVSPFIVLGMVACRAKEHCRKNEERQEETLRTLKEIRDAVRKTDSSGKPI